MDTTPEAGAAAPKPRAPRAEQDQRIQNDITQYVQDIQAVRKDTALAAGMTELGFDSAALADGQAHAASAQSAYTHRQTAMGAEEAALKIATDADETARRRYVHYRDVVRIAYPRDPAARKALGATGIVPKDRQKLVTLARAAYQGALQPPYAEALAKRGYNAAGLGAAELLLDSLDSATAALTAASRAAVEATTARNDAYSTLTAWGVPFRAAIRRARKK
ncbi:hypothetical protein [Armatimonas sp.]|uniref:hypothetical protein n=1 Tax=Armatimonas sp. TaxID=1872638 RepID=UPI0037536C2E